MKSAICICLLLAVCQAKDKDLTKCQTDLKAANQKMESLQKQADQGKKQIQAKDAQLNEMKQQCAGANKAGSASGDFQLITMNGVIEWVTGSINVTKMIMLSGVHMVIPESKVEEHKAKAMETLANGYQLLGDKGQEVKILLQPHLDVVQVHYDAHAAKHVEMISKKAVEFGNLGYEFGLGAFAKMLAAGDDLIQARIKSVHASKSELAQYVPQDSFDAVLTLLLLIVLFFAYIFCAYKLLCWGVSLSFWALHWALFITFLPCCLCCCSKRADKDDKKKKVFNYNNNNKGNNAQPKKGGKKRD